MKTLAGLVFALALGLQTMLTTTVSADEVSEQPIAERILDFFLDKCVDPLRTQGDVNTSDMVRLTGSQVQQLETRLGVSFDGLQFWEPTGSRALLYLENASSPE